MIPVDTSVWVVHLRAGNERLSRLLDQGSVLTHPFVIGELALGSLRQRARVLEALSDMPRAVAAGDVEVLGFIERHALFGRDIGYVDAHLLASVMLTTGASLWTFDKRLREVATQIGMVAEEP